MIEPATGVDIRRLPSAQTGRAGVPACALRPCHARAPRYNWFSGRGVRRRGPEDSAATAHIENGAVSNHVGGALNLRLATAGYILNKE